MCSNLFLHSSVNRHLGCFQFWQLRAKLLGTINIAYCLYMLLGALVTHSSWFVPRQGCPGSQGIKIFSCSFPRPLHPLLFLPEWVRISSAPHLSNSWYFRAVHFSLLGECVMIFPGGFILHFLDGKWSKHIFTYSLAICISFLWRVYGNPLLIFLLNYMSFLTAVKEPFLYSGH